MTAMSGNSQYGNAPITEAIIDLQVTFETNISMDRLEEAFAGERRMYSSKKRLQEASGRFQFGPIVSSSATTEDLGFAFSSVDGKQVVQFRRNGFTFSRLEPYESWEPFAAEARRLWDVYRIGLSPSSVIRLAVRYINRIQLPPAVDEISLWFNTYPEVADSVSTKVAGFFMQVIVPQPALLATLALTETVDDQNVGSSPAIILDLDLFRNSEVPQSEESIWDFFEQLHVRKNEVFEACITDKTRELIK